MAVGAAGKYGIARYFFHRTVVRGNAKRDKIQKMTDTDRDAYTPGICASREWLARQPQEEVYITSRDELRFHGMFFCCEDSGKAAVCFHDYTSEGLNDYTSIAKSYLSQGFSLMAVGERAHGKSEGIYIGFGCLDRNDAKQRMEYMMERLGEDCGLMLHGISMGTAIMPMSTGLNPPKQVRAAVSDCVFTSVREVFSHVLRSMYHMLAFSVMQIVDRMARSEAEYGLDECNAREEIRKARIPILLIHEDRDTLVPCSVVRELYEVCTSPKELLVIPRVSYAEMYYKEADRCEHAIEELIARSFGKKENKV